MSRFLAGLFLLTIAGSWTSAILAEEPGNSTVRFEDLFRAAEVQSIDLSPTAEFLVYRTGQEIYVGNSDLGYILIYDFRDDERVRSIQWIGDNSLVVQTYNRSKGRWRLHSSKMGPDEDGKYAEIAWEHHTVDGYVDDVLLDDPDKIVFARYRREDEFVAADFFQINVYEKSNRLFRRRNTIDTGSDDFIGYVRDQAGNYVVGYRYHNGVPEIWRRDENGKGWTRRWAATKESEIDPVSISLDGRFLFALSNVSTDKMAAVEFDLRSGSPPRVMYEHERFDLDGILLDEDQPEPYGVTYSEQGLLRYHFFADDPRAEFNTLQQKFRDRGIAIIGRSSDNNVLLVRTSTSKDRGQIQRCDLASDTCEMLVSLSPWLEGKVLSDTVVLQSEAEEGVAVDAFLTLPVAGGESLPLIVMPHGGPIGVRDSRYFSSDVQWLAHNGYAVLQVNYRGSSGYGKGFVEAGLREWGRGIEDDIDAAVGTALGTYPQLDRNRIGIFGASYGGYSALMSVIRNPDLYQCGASFAGVTDLTLLFSQSRLQKNPALREQLVRIVGDPDLDYEEQTANSPVYRYKEIQRPIFLAHGTDDRVVDIEHSWRLRELMRLRGINPEFVVIDDVAHGFAYISEAESLYEPLLSFLDKHLMPNAH